MLGALSACIPATVPPPTTANSQTPAPHLPTDLVALIEPEPIWNARQVVPDADTILESTYVVQSGDTLRSIGNRTGAGSEILAMVNNIPAPFIIHPGQRLHVPAGRYHLVSEGETGIAIARAYSVAWRDIVALNGLEDPFILRRGQRLLIPSETDPRDQTLEQRAAAFRIDIDDILTGGQPALKEGEHTAAASTAAKPLPTTAAISEPSSFSGSFTWPLSGPVIVPFGPGAGGQRNDGLDIQAPKGTPIHAAADGVIAYAGDEIKLFGGLVLINHGSGWVTAYGHADTLNVVRGQKVTKGQVIGLSGASGFVSEPKLHFEIRKDRKPVDPLSHLPKAS
ncbi:M23 family metallopeptidase [Rhizorhapis sp. SPR117]|uniref:peptidoglycan DD-metalloendopeptidase family protein n=1 Tax=Rhizorhapis sp. SPR117 TaxID=2912611 RepID=UPI001F29560F|nr:M23 family metallopeptidase [Rhizorhapis sp. SPR117]